MKENFLQFIWQYQLQQKGPMKLITGEDVQVIHPGIHNTDAGPDFFNAKIKIGKTLWAGNVEVHVNSSDWIDHGHQANKAYDNVILQVVYNNDCSIKRSNGEEVPTLQLTFDNRLHDSYQELIKNRMWVACQDEIKNIEDIYIRQWLGKLSIERVEQKSGEILERLHQNKNNWEETFYQYIAKNFGFKVNAFPFEMLAKSTPLNILAKHKNNLTHIEAMLFGQAGMLEGESTDKYHQTLKKEYQFFSKKFELAPNAGHLWKFLRLRPVNFPTIRIAQFAGLIYKSSALFSKILEAKTIEELKKLFEISASFYWDVHYLFGKESPIKEKRLGDDAFYTIAINTIVPFTFVYGKYYDDASYQEKALNWLEEIPAEKNNNIKKWEDIGIHAANAFDSQALLQLKNAYCNQKRCLQCPIGNKIITGAMSCLFC